MWLGLACAAKNPINLCAPPEFLKQICLPCLIIIQSCYFDCRTNKNSHVLAASSVFRALFTWSPRATCAKNHGCEPRGISYMFRVIVWVRVVLRKTVAGDWRFHSLSGSHLFILKGPSQPLLCLCLHPGTRLTKLLEISTKKYLITKKNS